MKNILDSARSIVHILLGARQEEVTKERILGAIEKAEALNIIEGETFDKKELFEILQADFSIGKG